MILDTNALSAFFEGDIGLLAVIKNVSRLYLPVIVLGEYRFGLLHSKKRRILEPVLDALEAAATVLVIEADTVRPYVDLRDRLKRAGTPIPSNDLWIAALALQHALPIVSRDKHFDGVRGVARVDW